MEAELGLEVAAQVLQVAVDALLGRQQSRDLPEVGLLLARGRTERLRVDRAEPLGEDPEAGAAEQLAGVVERPLEVGGALDEQVRDRERRLVDERRVVAARSHLLGPDPPRDVDQDSAAVALAVDVAGAMQHLLEVAERQRDRLAARRGVLADRGVDRTGVVVVDRRRRDQRAPGQVRGVAIQLDLPGSAPSSSGRATGLGPMNYRIAPWR